MSNPKPVKHSITLRLKIPRLADLVMRENHLNFRDALRFIYNSAVYTDLADEETKVWHYSELMLYDLLIQEKTTGRVEYP